MQVILPSVLVAVAAIDFDQENSVATPRLLASGSSADATMKGVHCTGIPCLRPHRSLNPSEAVATRVFEFQRRNGAWQINQQYFNPNVATATPTLGTVERWVFRNGTGGWWHPVHVHLCPQQIMLLNGRPPRPEDSFKSDLVILHGGGEAEVLIHFRTFRGPFVFHCHTVEHEDMRMMLTVDPRVTPASSRQPIQSAFF